MQYTWHGSPIGTLLLAGPGRSVEGGPEPLALLGLPNGRMARAPQPGWTRDDGCFAAVREQLDDYFLGKRRDFDLALAPAGTPFLLHGGGRFECALGSTAATDALLAQLPAISAHAAVAEGVPARRGVGTPLDPGQQRLCDRLEKALDPHGILV